MEITIVGVYAPNCQQRNYWEKLLLKTEKVVIKNMIIIGDFNAVFDPRLDRSENTKALEIQSNLKRLLELYNLLNSWRAMHGLSRD